MLLFVSPRVGAADFDTESSSLDFGARISAGVDKKFLAKRLTVSVREEARFYDCFSTLERSYTSLGATYKLNNWVKAGVNYDFIAVAPEVSEPSWTRRHRFQGSLTASYGRGMFKASLRGMAQMMHRTDDINLFQQPRNAWALRTRLKASYEVLGTPFTPFLSCELLCPLNAVDYASLGDNVKGSTTNSVIYGDAYLNRVRIQAGTEYYINKRNSLDFYLMCDLESDRKVDATRYGVPKSYDLERSSVFTVGIDYNFSWKR